MKCSKQIFKDQENISEIVSTHPMDKVTVSSLPVLQKTVFIDPLNYFINK